MADPRKRDPRNTFCVVTAIATWVSLCLSQVYIKQIGTDLLIVFKKTGSPAEAYVICFIIAGMVFTLSKIFLFFWHCCRSCHILKNSVYPLRITVEHYARIITDYMFLLSAQLLLGAIAVGTVHVVSYMVSGQVSASGGYTGKTPISKIVHVSYCTDVIVFAGFSILPLVSYFFIKRHFNDHPEYFGHCMLQETHNESLSKPEPYPHSPDEIIREKLKTLKDCDFIFIAAIHNHHILGDETLPKEISASNPNACIMFLPQWPFSWHMIERCVELKQMYRTEYYSEILTSVKAGNN